MHYILIRGTCSSICTHQGYTQLYMYTLGVHVSLNVHIICRGTRNSRCTHQGYTQLYIYTLGVHVALHVNIRSTSSSRCTHKGTRHTQFQVYALWVHIALGVHIRGTHSSRCTHQGYTYSFRCTHYWGTRCSRCMCMYNLCTVVVEWISPLINFYKQCIYFCRCRNGSNDKGTNLICKETRFDPPWIKTKYLSFNQGYTQLYI